MDGIFISYRRDDAPGYAGRLYDRLAAHFGADRVFMDVEGIEPGADFIDAIERAVGSCAVLIVIIGRDWLARDRDGRRRLDDPQDFVRLETRVALARGIRVVPVLVEGASMPRGDELPKDLNALVRRQAVELSHAQWEATSGELIRTLEKILKRDAPVASPEMRVRVTPPRVPGDDDKRDRRAWWIGGALAAIVAALVGTYAMRSRAPSPEPAQTSLVGSTAELDFAERGVHATGEGRLLWIRNEGGRSVHVSSVKISGKDAADFSVVDDACSAREIAPAASCALRIGFKPDSAGPREARLVVSAQAGASPADIALRGRGRESVASAETSTRDTMPAAEPAKTEPAKTEPAKTDSAKAGPAKAERAKTEPPARVERAAIESKAAETPTTPTSPSSTAKASPPPSTAAAAPSSLPRIGDLWQYRTRSMWKNVEPQTYTHRIVAASDQALRETVTAGDSDANAQTRSITSTPELIEWRGQGFYFVEFNPFIGAFGALTPGASWKALATPVDNPLYSGWYTQGRVVGSDTVSVPAGTFRAQRVEINSARRPTGSPMMQANEPARVVYVVWYAPETKRMVKQVRTVSSISGIKLDEETCELVKYALR